MRHTKTHTYLAVKQETFDDVRDRLIRAYPEGSDDYEHYMTHEKKFDWDTPIVGVCLGEIMLVVEGSDYHKQLEK